VSEALDPETFRHVLGHFPTGVVLVTAVTDIGPVGMTIGSFTSVSLDPPLVAFLPRRDSATFAKIRGAGRFCVNILASDQQQLCRKFAGRDRDRFTGIDWMTSPLGSPILSDVLAWVDCEIDDALDAGDHYIVVGRVCHLETGRQGRPLLFFQGGYGEFSAMWLTAPAQHEILAQLRYVDQCRAEMQELAAEADAEVFASAAQGDQVILLGSASQRERHPATGGRIGQRTPFMAPMAGALAAWATDPLREDWITRRLKTRPGERPEIEAILERIRVRGWSITLESETLRQMEAVAARGNPTAPSHDDWQAMLSTAERMDLAAYEPEDPFAGERVHVRFISAPIFDSSGHAVLLLSIFGRSADQDRPRIEHLRDRLVVSAAKISAALGYLPARESGADGIG
jgi:flavin reductase (DIM6/NTAB) family NADH-FMN oxidoreductase RutF/DNA-binding IclR family transcriptional regulator